MREMTDREWNLMIPQRDFTNRLVLKIITGRFHIMHGQKDR